MKWLLVVLAATGCLEAQSQFCGDKVCAPNARCDEPTGTCIPAGCGDGVVNNKEQCDGAALGGVLDCTSLGYYDHHSVGCTLACELDTSSCEESCGDHAVDGPELCDGEPPAGQSCLDYGYGVGRIACANACTPSFDDCTTVGLTLQASFTHALHAVDGRAKDDAYAVGGSGEILHFDGTSWSHVGTTSSTGFSSLWVDKSPGGRVVVAVGNDGTGHAAIARYDGQTWTEIHPPGVDDMNGVWGVGPDDLWAVGGTNIAGSVIHFDGTSWGTPITVGATALNAVTGDPQTGHLVAVGNGKATATFDGTNWIPAADTCDDCTDSNYSFQAVLRIDGPTEYIAVGSSPQGEPAVAASSIDGGLTWQPLPQTKQQTTLTAISGVRGDVYIAGSTGTLLRFDGKVFHSITTGTLTLMSGIWRAAADEIVVTFNQGEIRTLDAAAWIDAGPIAADTVRLQGVASSNGETIVVGNPSTIISSANGVTWSSIAPALAGDTNMTAAWFASPGEAFVASAQPGVFYRPTLASSFALLQPPPPPSLPYHVITTAIFGTSSTNIYAAGHVGRIFHGTGTTSAWVQQQVPGSTADLSAIWGSGPNDLYAVGDESLIAHSTDGATWTPIVIPGLISNLSGIWGSGSDDIFVVGTKGTILHFDGDAWRLQHTDNSDLVGVFGIAIPDPGNPGHNARATDVFAFGTDAMFHYDGVSWSPMSLPLLFGVLSATALDGADRNDVFFVGTHGNAARLSRPLAATEHRCSDGWDDDRNGLVDCADPACATSDECTVTGGACRLEATLACDSTLAGTTFTGIASLDALPMLPDLTDGPEAVYRFDATATGMVTIALDTPQPLDLLVTSTHPGTAACDLQQPLAAHAGAGSVTFAAEAGHSYVIIVDGAAGSAGEFTLTTTCP